MVEYSSQREAFGKSLQDFGQIQRLIADAFAQMSAGRALLYETAAHMDLGFSLCVAVCCSVLQCVAVCCRVLQCASHLPFTSLPLGVG